MTQPSREVGKHSDLDGLEKQYREQLQRQFHETDRLYTGRLCQRYHDLVPSERIRAMQDLPTIFDDRKQFEQSYLRSSGEKPEDNVVGFSRGTIEPAHVATDHVQIRKTIIHERLHQLSDPESRERLGGALNEGITEDLAIKEMGTDWDPELPRSYPEERALAHQVRDFCGDRAMDQAYFRGDTGELRLCLDRQLGKSNLDAFREMADDSPCSEHELEQAED